LWSFFEEKFGPVADAMVAYFPNGASRGFGFVTFQQEKPASSAARLHYLPFHGKRVRTCFTLLSPMFHFD
jgi:RNA recognition motif-containing protein